MNMQGMFKPALIGGVLLGVLSALPVINIANCLCCAWVVGGGILAAYLYVKDSPTAVTLGSGLALGLLTGAIGSAVSILFLIPLQLMPGAGKGLTEPLLEALDQMPNIPVETREMLRSVFSEGDSGSLGIILVVGGLMQSILFCLVAMLGGALGVALFEKRKPGSKPPGPGEGWRPPTEFSSPPHRDPPEP